MIGDNYSLKIKMQNNSIKFRTTKDQKGFTPHLNSESAGIAKGNRNLSAGFTLIEAIMAIFVFSILSVIIASIFARAISIERRTVSSQRVQENALLFLESIAKEIRVSNFSSVANQDSPCDATTLTMVHPVSGNVTYSLSGTNILRQANFASFVNSSDVEFTRLKFCIVGSGPNDNQPVRITILVSLRSKGGTEQVSADLQTTVISRDVLTELQNL